MSLKRTLIASLAGILVIALVMGGWWYYNVRPTNSTASNIPVYTPGQSAPGSSSGSATPSKVKPASPPPPACAAQGQPIIPQSLTIDRMNVKSHVLSLGWDNGAAAAPPKNDSQGVGWWNQGPKPGSNKGKVLLTIHTYRNGNALGNALNDPTKGLHPGDVIRLTDASGRTMCYTYTNPVKVYVKDYDPDSKLIYDFRGEPQVVIVICWDYNWQSADWDSRILFYASPLYS